MGTVRVFGSPVLFKKGTKMKNKVITHSIRYLIVSTMLIMIFAKNSICDILLIGNAAIWLVVEIVLLAKKFECNTDNEPETDAPSDNAEVTDAENWYSFFGRSILTELVTDLNTRGYRRLEIDEYGEVTISEGEIELIDSFPKQSVWNVLVREMQNDGLSASISGERIVVEW